MIDRLFWLLFSFRGRIGRATFAILSLCQFAAWAIYQVQVWRRYTVVSYDDAHKAHAVLDAPPAVGVVMFFLVAVAIWVALAAQVKRLHDFSWSGWWLAAPVAGGLIAGFLAAIFAALQSRFGLMLVAPLLVVAGVTSIALALMMFLRPGVWAENGYPRGPDEESSGSDAPRRGDGRAPSHTPPGRPGAAHAFGRRGSHA